MNLPPHLIRLMPHTPPSSRGASPHVRLTPGCPCLPTWRSDQRPWGVSLHIQGGPQAGGGGAGSVRVKEVCEGSAGQRQRQRQTCGVGRQMWGERCGGKREREREISQRKVQGGDGLSHSRESHPSPDAWVPSCCPLPTTPGSRAGCLGPFLPPPPTPGSPVPQPCSQVRRLGP